MMTWYFAGTLGSPGEYRYYDTVFHFRYPGFEFVPVVSDDLLMIVFAIGLVASVLVFLGYYYWVAISVLAVVYVYQFLIDQTYFNNHYYFYLLVNFFLVAVPTNKYYSIDSLQKRAEGIKEERWMLLLFQLQICIVYFYGGLSKLSNPEWLNTLATQSLYALAFKKYAIDVSDSTLEYTGYFIAYGGMFFDLLVPFGLMSRNKLFKGLAVSGAVFFNLSNVFAFNIGSFPFSMLASLVIFLWYPNPDTEEEVLDTNQIKRKLVVGVLSTYFLVQLILPFRHFLIDGNVFWTAEAKMWSWHMMSGQTEVNATFYIDEFDEEGALVEAHEIEPSKFLNVSQMRNLGKYPYCIPQFARFIKREAKLAGMTDVKVYADVIVMRNNKTPRFIVDPNTELSSVYYNNSLVHNRWILTYKSEDYWY